MKRIFFDKDGILNGPVFVVALVVSMIALSWVVSWAVYLLPWPEGSL